MNKRATEIDSQLDETRARITQTVSDINKFLSPMAFVARNFEKFSAMFAPSDVDGATESSSNPLVNTITSLSKTFKRQ